ncbi:hypothetical protein ACFHW2_12230 [Actinomadura sp. LOL_016]|uniref:hypothetical protein n=1 Tax=unclassified Actinomadura TaxID=2626254 RepID=UPI003A8061C8
MMFIKVLAWTALIAVHGAAVLSFLATLRHRPELNRPADLLFAIGFWLAFIACAVSQDVFRTAFFGSGAVLFTWLWWKNRPRGRGRRALRELGAKSRARVRALADRMTPSPIPSPVGGRA